MPLRIQPTDHLSMRQRGIALIGLSLPLGYIGVYKPICEALEHVQNVTIFKSLIIIFPFTFLHGLTIAILGDRYIPIFGDHKHATKLGYLFMALLAALGVVFYYFFQSYMSNEFHYTFK